MNVGDTVILCDGLGSDHTSRLEEIRNDKIVARIIKTEPSGTEPRVKISVYQALPKLDKMDDIIQKSVELGVHDITPIISSRTVSRPDGAALDKKNIRWNRIARAAAKQSRRGIIPAVRSAVDIKDLPGKLSLGHTALLYELEKSTTLREWLDEHSYLSFSPHFSLSIIAGPEGGFAPEEVSLLTQSGVTSVNLGSRILRTQTAICCALSASMFYFGEF
jgi:16S rRNA (uracil1498-N3)-methyltransferase